MLTLSSALSDWGQARFAESLKAELEQLAHTDLPLQAGLRQSSYVSDSPFQVTVLRFAEDGDNLTARVGVFYQGIIAGSCCADDPSPVDELNEYCEMDIRIDKATAQASISLALE